MLLRMAPQPEIIRRDRREVFRVTRWGGILSILLLPACEILGDIEERTEDDLEVVATYPADGASAVPEDIRPAILLSKAIPQGMVLGVTLRGPGGNRELECVPNEDADSLLCPLKDPLSADSAYTLEVDLGANGEPEASVRFTTSLPSGLGYDIGDALTVEEAGGSSDAASLLQVALADAGTLLVVLDGFSGNESALPWEGTWLMGRGQILPGSSGEGEGAVREEEGYPLAAWGELDTDGEFYAQAETAFLPMDIDGTSVPVWVTEVEMRGNIDLQSDFNAMPAIYLNALVPERSLDALTDALPDWGELLTGLISLDVDADGDGQDDSASLKLSSAGERVELVDEIRD